jgi:hypothetical protein
MYKTITIIFIALYGCFVVFARQPDYFDGEVTTASVHYAKDSATQATIPFANFSIGSAKYSVKAAYPLRPLDEGETLEIIYEAANPTKATVYSIWGYWILWDELSVSLVIYLILFYAAVSITDNPTPVSLIEQLEFKEEKKRKYK